MKKRNAVLHAAVTLATLAMGAGAQAGSADSFPVTFATELFGTGSSATVLTTPAGMNVTYTLGVGRTSAAGAFQVTYTMAGGAQFSTAVTNGDVTLSSGGGCAASASVRSGGAASDTSVVFDVTPSADCAAGQTITFALPDLKAATALATAGTKLTMNVALKDLFGDFDTGGTHTTNIATSAASLSKAITANSGTSTTASPDNPTIDAINQASKFFADAASATGNDTVRLGTVVFGDVAGSKKADGATDRVRLAGDKISVTVTGDFSAALASTKKVYLSNSVACATSDVTTSTTLTATTATFTNVDGNTPATNICMQVDGSTAITASSYSATATYTPAIATEVATTVASTALMSTALNTTQKDTRIYVPSAATGFNSFVRVINTSSTSGSFSVALIAEDGTVGNSGTLGTVAARGTRIFTPAEIEAVVGSLSSSARPRLRITAPVTAFEVQSFLGQPNGNISDMTGAQ